MTTGAATTEIVAHRGGNAGAPGALGVFSPRLVRFAVAAAAAMTVASCAATRDVLLGGDDQPQAVDPANTVRNTGDNSDQICLTRLDDTIRIERCNSPRAWITEADDMLPAGVEVPDRIDTDCAGELGTALTTDDQEVLDTLCTAGWRWSPHPTGTATPTTRPPAPGN